MAILSGQTKVNPQVELELNLKARFTLIGKIGMLFMRVGAWLVNKGGVLVDINKEE